MARITPVDDFKKLIDRMAKEPINRGFHRVDVVSNKTYHPRACYGCGAATPYFRPRIKHINIYQNPTIKFFCCKSCRDSWASGLKTKFDPAKNDLPTKMVIFKYG